MCDSLRVFSVYCHFACMVGQYHHSPSNLDTFYFCFCFILFCLFLIVVARISNIMLIEMVLVGILICSRFQEGNHLVTSEHYVGYGLVLTLPLPIPALGEYL